MVDWIGKQLGPYQIVAEIGRGGMAVVYKAYQPSQRRYVALKVLLSYSQQDAELTARFLREGEAAKALDHPNIVYVYEVGQAEGVYYIAMEYVDGGSLAAELSRRRGPLDLTSAVRIVNQIGAALTHAHSHGIIHRDVKPSNILLNSDGRALLSDFGIAKAIGRMTITQPGTLLGTPAYMSPEQAKGRRDLDHRTDVYSLGVVLYEMLTGDVPFHGDSPTVILRCILDEPPPSPSRVNATISRELERVVLRTLAKEREKRYQTIGEMLAALEAATYLPRPAGATPRGRAAQPTVLSPPRTTPTPRPGARPTVAPFMVALAALAMVAALLVILRGSSPPRTATPPATAEAGQPTSTNIPATDTPAASPTGTATKTPTPTPTLAAVPNLLEPSNGASVTGAVQLRWQWPHSLKGDERFDVRVWLEGESEHGVARTDKDQCEFRSDKGGRYHWRIVVIRIDPARPDDPQVFWDVSGKSEPRSFIYAPPVPIQPTEPVCTVHVGACFAARWTGEKSLRTALGCPAEEMHSSWMAEEPFERGYMLWREYDHTVFVFFNSGTWRSFADQWQEGMPEYDCAAPAPAGLLQPKRGFGLVWCREQGVSPGLGWAMREEQGYTNEWQLFERGQMIASGGRGTIYALFADGTFLEYPAH